MINQVTLLGRVGSKPEIKISTRENKFARFSIATSEKFKNKQGEWQEKTQWHKICCFNSRFAETLEKYIDKGRMLFIQGQIETREYDDNGTTKYITEIVIPTFGGAMRIIDSKGGSGGSNKSTQGTKETQSNKEEDIPF